ncbi:TonB-dependent receptor [Rhodoferax sp.]|uniref:TonB-dependent receptor domain-containing protein n=1 Tax=Rhodoferax sp. TaxID=50421 RepID=UPI0025D0DA29|nr:TonB-dependent receptor [Rhodoferax sp.]
MKTLGINKRGCAPVRLGASVLAVFAAFPVLVQAQTEAVLSEVVVTASRNEQLLGSTLPHTTVISRQDIERSQVADLVTLLQREAGLQKTQNGGVGTVSSVFLRGAPSLQTLVLIDGVPQNKQDASGSVSLEHLMLDNIERVEIVRGNVSAIYGSGAIGGVIQIFTRTGSREPSANLSLELGPRDWRKISGSVSANLGATSFSAGLSRVTTDGFSAIDTEQLPGANPDADGYSNTSGNFSLVHRLANAHSFGLRFMQSDADNDYDNAFGAPTDIQTSTTRLTQTTLFSDNTWGNWRSRLSLSENSDKSSSQDDGFYGSSDGFTTRATMLRWVNTLVLGENWLASAGLEQQRQRVATSSDSAFVTPYNEERDASALFAGLEGKLGSGNLQLNVRRDEVGDLSQNTGYLGYSYPVTNQFKVTASASSAFNAPPLGYLYAPYYGNPALKPESAYSQELGAQYEQGSQWLRVVYFNTRVKDQLTYDNTTFAFANLGRTRNSGWELSYRGSVQASDLRASLTLQDPVDDITGQRLQRRAATLLSLGVSHPVGAWRLGADLQYSGDRPDAYSDPVTFSTVKTTLEAYTVLNLSLSYQVAPGVELKARLDNALDENYQTVYGYNQQPRSLYVGVSWTPKI